MINKAEIIRRLEEKGLCPFVVKPISKVDIWIKNTTNKDTIDTFIDFCNASKSDVVFIEFLSHPDSELNGVLGLNSEGLSRFIEVRKNELGLKKLSAFKQQRGNELTLKLEIQEKYQNYLNSLERFTIDKVICSGYCLYTYIDNNIFGIMYSDNEFWTVYNANYLDELLKEYYR